MADVDALVVGAGPVGLTAASERLLEELLMLCLCAFRCPAASAT
ncbi:hypothetical protein ACWIG5_36695 [Streptomyces lydicus]